MSRKSKLFRGSRKYPKVTTVTVGCFEIIKTIPRPYFERRKWRHYNTVYVVGNGRVSDYKSMESAIEGLVGCFLVGKTDVNTNLFKGITSLDVICRRMKDYVDKNQNKFTNTLILIQRKGDKMEVNPKSVKGEIVGFGIAPKTKKSDLIVDMDCRIKAMQKNSRFSVVVKNTVSGEVTTFGSVTKSEYEDIMQKYKGLSKE